MSRRHSKNSPRRIGVMALRQEARAHASLNSAIAAYREGRLDAAVYRAREADSILPRNPQIRFYLELFIWEKAGNSLEACLKDERLYPEARFQFSLAYNRLSNEESAKQRLDNFKSLRDAATATAQML